MKLSDKIFYFIQAIFTHLEFALFDRIRPIIYRPFFRGLKEGTRICSNVHFKYPSEIEIGAHVYIGRGSILTGAGGLHIGDHTLIAAGTKICTTTHIADDLTTPVYLQGIRNKSINIGSNVWVGFDAKILLGSIVGSHSIVGANSVLLEDSSFAEYSIIAGIPANLIGRRDVKK